MSAFKILFVAVIMILAASPVAAESCKQLQIRYFNALKPVMHPDGDMSVTADQDPSTLQLVIIKRLGTESSTMSKDGQVIYLSPAVLDTDRMQSLFYESIVRRIMDKEPKNACVAADGA